MTVCIKERTTQHHLGSGYGQVQDEEDVVMGIFSDNPKNGPKHKGERLVATSFRRKDLAHGNVSLARRTYMPLESFQKNVVEPRERTAGKFVGVVVANVKALRDIYAYIRGVHPRKSIRGICVLDKVEGGDFDAHAALEYSEDQGDLSDPQKDQVRDIIASDLANKFSPIQDAGVVLLSGNPDYIRP